MTGSPTISVASTSGTNSRTSQSGTFAYEWTVTATSISVGESPRLSLITSGIIAEGDTTTITQPTGDDAYRDHLLAATVPTITASDAIRTNNAGATTRGGDVSWDITFDQVVTGVDAVQFSVSHGGSVTGVSAVSGTTNIVDGLEESRVWRITANLPTSGQGDIVSVALTLNPTSGIKGSRGLITSGTSTQDGRLDYTAGSSVQFTTTYSLQTVEITSIEFAAYADRGARHELTSSTLLGNSVDTAVQSPSLLRYIITYNLPVRPTIGTYGLNCSPVNCYIRPDIVSSRNRHAVHVRNLPDFTGTVKLVNGSSPAVDLSSRTDATFYSRPRINFDVHTAKTDDDATIVVNFSEAVTGFELSDINLLVGGSSVTPTFVMESPSVYSISTPLASFSDGVVFTITDVSPFIVDTDNDRRIFNPSVNPPLPFTHTLTDNFGTFPRVATAPTVDTITRVSTDFASAGGTQDTIAWDITFDQSVTNVDKDDFEVVDESGNSIATNIGVTSDADTYTITATLPTSSYGDRDHEVNLRIGDNNILGSAGVTSITDTTSITRPFGSATTITSSTHTPPTHYTLNNDNDDVTMMITRNDSRTQSAKVDGNTHEVSWTIEFGNSVRGVDTDGASSQFAINLDGESTSRDSASTDVMVTGSGTTYTATVALPQSSYPTTAELHLTASSTLSAITQVNNAHDNSVSPKVAGDILTDASNDYEVSTGSLTVASITSQTVADRTVVYTIAFNARVSNVTADNFALTQSGGTIPLTGSPTFSVASPTGTNSRTGQSGTFAYEWIVTTTSIPAGESPRLSLTTAGIIAEGDTTTITQPTGDDAHRDHTLDATAPTITASDAIRTNNADATTRGGAVSWDITFDQIVTGVDAVQFSVSHDGLVTGAVSDNGTTESRVWRITADLPTTGQSTGVSVALTLNPTTDIRGVGDIGYSAIDALTFTQTYSLRTLAITSIEFTAYANTSASTELTGPVLLANSVDTAVQSPVLLHYVVTYNLAPSAPTADTYNLSCSVPSCALSPTVSMSGNRHIINATNIPDATGTITLTNGSSPIVDMSSRTDTTFHFRPRITFDVHAVKADDDAIIVVTFSEAITGFELSDINLVIGGNSVTPTFAMESPSVYSFSTFLATFSDSDNVVFAITDTSPFVADTTNKHRIFNSVPNSPLPFIHTHTENFGTTPRVATAPTVDTITRVSTDFVSAGGTSDTIAWDLTFDQPVTNVDKDDFEVVDESDNSIATNISVTDDSNTYTITATLPTSSYGDRDYEVNLRIGDNNILGSTGATSITDITSISRPFGSATTITSSTHTPADSLYIKHR